MTVQLDGKQMQSPGAMHDHLALQLNLPEYYGRNLDALFDLLTERTEFTTIEIIDQKVMLEALDRYGEVLLKTLQQAADENPNLMFLAKLDERIQQND